MEGTAIGHDGRLATSETVVRLQVLGALRAVRSAAGQPDLLLELGGPRPRRLLFALAVDADRPVPPDRLAERVWGDRQPSDPRAALYTMVSRLRQVLGPEVIVTEGAIDALSAAAAGYRAVAVLSAAYGDEAVATSLAKLPHPLVIAFDADEAGRAGAHRLASLLEARQRPPVVIDLERGELNDTMRRANNWPDQMARTVAHAMQHNGVPAGVSVSR